MRAAIVFLAASYSSQPGTDWPEWFGESPPIIEYIDIGGNRGAFAFERLAAMSASGPHVTVVVIGGYPDRYIPIPWPYDDSIIWWSRTSGRGTREYGE